MVNKANWNKKQKKMIRENKDYISLYELLDCVERAKSNSSTCVSCGKRIGKGTIRGVSIVDRNMVKGGKPIKIGIKNKYCSKCTLDNLEMELKKIQQARRMIKSRKRTRFRAYEKQEALRDKLKLLEELK